MTRIGAVGFLLGALSASLAAVLIANAGDDSAGAAKPCCTRYCVEVSEREDQGDTLVRYVGRRWRPGKLVDAIYGPECDGEPCPNDRGEAVQVRANRRGRWVVTLREGSPKPGDRSAKVVPGFGAVAFEQWTGRRYDSRLIRRRAPGP
jgi:hypothetical protein